MVAAAHDPASVWATLEGVLDPEVPVLSVVELGIVRDVGLDADGRVTVSITPTYSGCPALQVIERDILDALARDGWPDARLRTVYSPAWTTDWIGEEARRKLEAYGIASPPAHASRDAGTRDADERETRVRTTSCRSGDVWHRWRARIADRTRPRRGAISGRPRAKR